MAKGYPPDIIPSVVQLPDNLADLPIFRPQYGVSQFNVRGIFDFYVGWFSGLTEDLMPVDRFERGSKLIRIIGRSQMRLEAAKAYNDQEYE
jgi:alkyl sulfatase BDS1-like metallo-beta-lactamase superfamily hydrolase